MNVRANEWFSRHRAYFKTEHTESIQSKLNSLNASQVDVLYTISLRHPVFLLFVELFFGVWGLHRFMLGHIFMGIFELLTGGFFGLLWFIDFFRVMGLAKEYNYSLVIQALSGDCTSCSHAKKDGLLQWLHNLAVVEPSYDYVVVDLSGGPNASSYPVRYTQQAPDLTNDTCCTTELWLRRIPAGTFIMGSPKEEYGRDFARERQHQVTLTQTYYIGVFPCTQRQWELVMGNRPSYFKNDQWYATRPVENILYSEIRGYSDWPREGHTVGEGCFMWCLREKTGLNFDLPTSAQWEYACRMKADGSCCETALNSGKNLTFEAAMPSSGIDPNMAEVGRFWCNSQKLDKNLLKFPPYIKNVPEVLELFKKEEESRGHIDNEYLGFWYGTSCVGSYRPSPLGLYDMHGNVNELCLDYWSECHMSSDAIKDPAGPSRDARYLLREARGGSWNHPSRECRCAFRGNGCFLRKCDKRHGFRIALVPNC